MGIAGGEEKCTYFNKDELGFDFAIDYKSESIGDKLKEYALDEITGYFDGIGGDATVAVFMNARNGMKMALCGSISEYDDKCSGSRIKNFNMMREKISFKIWSSISDVWRRYWRHKRKTEASRMLSLFDS